MEIDLPVLRQLEEQHRRVAAEIRDWAEPPHDWLRSFIPTYGKIAQPVKDALDDYYDARQRAGNALADDHDATADSLAAAARAYEEGDNEMGAQIRRAGDETSGGTPPSTSSPTPVSSGPSPIVDRVPGMDTSPAAAQPGEVPSAQSPAAGAPDVTAPQVPGTGGPGAAGDDPGSAAPGIAASASAPGTPTQLGATAPDGAQAGAGTTAGSGVAAGTTPLAGVPLAGTAAASAAAGQAGYGTDDRNAGGQSAATAGRSDGSPMPVVTPFAAAVAAAKDKKSEPDYVVGDLIDNDLLVARTLLAAVLAATESTTVGMHWSVAVMRGPAGAGVFITSNEGRGWLPAQMYLPREVSTPWSWDDMLDDGSGATASPWEGITDPARVLVEFGLAWGPKANAALVALASSAPIDGGLRTRFPDVAMEGMVGPEYEVDLRVHTPDTVDRLDLTGSAEAAASIAAVPDSQLREHCAALAGDAHGKLIRTAPAIPEASETRRIRDRILAVVEAGQQVSPQWWEELREADDMLAAAMLSRRVDVARVEPGELRLAEEGAVLRALVFERRCNELLLLLADDPTRQQLRDAAYAHDQVLNHPQFVEVPATVSTTEAATVDRAVPAGTRVTAPGVTAGPPNGAVVAPPSVPPPPVVTPGPGQGQGN